MTEFEANKKATDELVEAYENKGTFLEEEIKRLRIQLILMEAEKRDEILYSNKRKIKAHKNYKK